jgi:chemotaxis protein MotB
MGNSANSRNIQSLILIGSLLLIAVGCVSQAKHQELLNNYEDLTRKKSGLEQSCAESIDQLDAQTAALAEKTAELEKQNAEAAARAGEKADEAAAMAEMVIALEEKLAGEEARISQLDNALKIEVVDKLMFASGSAEVTKEGSKILAKIAPTLIAATAKDIVIIGHTDDLPPSANLARRYPSNWELSAARAASIVHILTWHYKISPTRMIIEGAAHYHPMTTFATEDKSARKTNRAVEIILKNPIK